MSWVAGRPLMIMMNEIRSETATPGMKTNAEIWDHYRTAVEMYRTWNYHGVLVEHELECR